MINIVKQSSEFEHRQRRAAARRLVGLRRRHPQPGSREGAGDVAHVGVLLGPEREDARMVEAFASAIPRCRRMIHAGTYGAVTHYLKAVAAAGTDDGGAVVAKMKEMPVDDFMTNGRRDPCRRPPGARHVPVPGQGAVGIAGPVRLLQAGHRPFPADKAFRPLHAGGCPLARRIEITAQLPTWQPSPQGGNHEISLWPKVPAPDDLTIVEAGSPMGELLRRYWQPVCTSDELRDLPKKVKILCEEVVVFRDKKGRVGALDPHCSHRGTSLEYARVEERGTALLLSRLALRHAGPLHRDALRDRRSPPEDGRVAAGLSGDGVRRPGLPLHGAARHQAAAAADVRHHRHARTATTWCSSASGCGTIMRSATCATATGFSISRMRPIPTISSCCTR